MRRLLPARPPGVLARRAQASALPRPTSARRRAPARALGSADALPQAGGAAACAARRAPPLPTAATGSLRRQQQQQQQQQRRGRRRGTTTAAAAADGSNSNPPKLYDVVGVSNLCVDVVLPVDALPPPDPAGRRALLARLRREPPSLDAWEVGGSCNFMIAAARLGLRVAAVGHTGEDPAGRYLEAVLEGEGVGPLLQLARGAAAAGGGGNGGDGGASSAAGSVVASGPAGAAAALAAVLSSDPAPAAAAQRVLLEEQERLRQQGVLSSAAAAARAAQQQQQQQPGADAAQTLLCFVLVDPAGGHAFCSAYDFGPWPLLMDALEASAAQRGRRPWVEEEGEGEEATRSSGGNGSSSSNVRRSSQAEEDDEALADAAAAERLLPPSVLSALSTTRALYLNGFVFDELPLAVVRAMCRAASSSGAAVFFDPGPRAHTMREGARRAALDAVLDLADVVLMTEEEAGEVTGVAAGDAEGAARAVLARGGCRTRWAVVKRGPEGAVLVAAAEAAAEADSARQQQQRPPHHRHYASPAVPVDVTDTVGCGDSFAAAAVLGFTRGCPPDETLALANAVGAATATGRGAGTNVASAPRVLGLLERQVERGGDGAAAAEGAIRMLRASLLLAGAGDGGGGGGGGGAAAAGAGAAAAAANHEDDEEAAAAAAVAAAREEAAAEQQRQQRQWAAADCRQQQQQQSQPRLARRQPTTAV